MLWGLNYSLNERVFQGKVQPATLLIFQGLASMLIALCVGFPHVAQDLKTVQQDRSTLYVAVGALLTYGLGNLLISLSIQAKNATLAGLVELSYPIFTVLFTYLLFRQLHLNSSVIAGGVLILIGIVLVSRG
jgi:drug/metabolite transporter (DMT)-like permease